MCEAFTLLACTAAALAINFSRADRDSIPSAGVSSEGERVDACKEEDGDELSVADTASPSPSGVDVLEP